MIFMKHDAAQAAAPLVMPVEAIAFDEASRRRAPLQLLDHEPVALPDPVMARVAVVGLGYVGLPLICGFSHNSRSIGLDIDGEKIAELKNQIDRTGEVTGADLAEADALYTTDASDLADADVILVCVPTPVNSRNRPDYTPLLAASRDIGMHMKKGCVVVYESTVDPGTTEEKCLPILEATSGLREGVDFYLGYSPERINPADPTRKLADIKKIVAGSTPVVTEFLEVLYSRVVKAGLFPAASIRVAEAAKILENTQRDVNIALMNELMALYDKMGIRASDVIAAASSKWNFHNYRPGMVGGHCIAVDPYYLVDAGRRHGLSMELVAAGRSVNEQTPYFLVDKLEELFASKGERLAGKRVLVLGRSFKEDCPDTRNSKTFKMMDYMWAQGAEVFNFDPVADDDHAEGGRGTTIVDDPFEGGAYHAVIVTLGHRVFREQLDLETLTTLAPKGAPLIDMRGQYDGETVHDHFNYWRP
ncbi:nucleotide sugar dehydrogenase [Ahrensia sp. R2A130]|uniref:nucleotide sugar dehydrogenase n=1 Tax=Ahrensia sp. R2A130 TaxID=744979 RepID=UPI0001E0C33B|nr:nucleotide sugar dehydrogenase [Ahrensia sp. R2A130]EFL90819.1 protein CapL [Ahrensia sp. R2A130]